MIAYLSLVLWVCEQWRIIKTRYQIIHHLYIMVTIQHTMHLILTTVTSLPYLQNLKKKRPVYSVGSKLWQVGTQTANFSVSAIPEIIKLILLKVCQSNVVTFPFSYLTLLPRTNSPQALLKKKMCHWWSLYEYEVTLDYITPASSIHHQSGILVEIPCPYPLNLLNRDCPSEGGGVR